MFRFFAYGQVRRYSYHGSYETKQNERTTCIVRSARTWPRPGAQVAPQQSLILPPGCQHDPHSFFGTQVDIHPLTGELFANAGEVRQLWFRSRGTLGPGVSSKWYMVSLLTSNRLERRWIPGRSQANTPCRRIRTPSRRPDDRRARLPATSPVRGSQPRIHEGMCWGAVGPRPFTSGKRTRHDLVTPDRL